MLNPQEALAQTRDHRLNAVAGLNNFAERDQNVESNITSCPKFGYTESDAASDSPQEDVDESVKKDMRKLSETFAGISERFRLINRIGEGMSPTRRK